MLERHYNSPSRKSFRTATRLYAGRDARLDLPGLLPDAPVVLVVDRYFADCDLAAALRPVITMTVQGEPLARDVETLNATCAGLKPGAVVALGGGSTIDTAKAVHAALCFPCGVPRDVERPAGAPLLISVPTTAGSGSETSRFFILSDAAGIKCSHRAWSFAPDLAVLDPALIEKSGTERLMLGAFDTFVHLWETHICRNESAPFIDMLAREGIGLIAAALAHLSAGTPLTDEHLMGLQRASAYGGFAISNVRTGLIHTLGESLAAQVPLSHPETLFVFLEGAIAHYRPAVEAQIESLDRYLGAMLGSGMTFDGLIAQWRALFDAHGISQRITAQLGRHPVDVERLRTTALRDVVLAKENPALLTPDILLALIEDALGAPKGAVSRSA